MKIIHQPMICPVCFKKFEKYESEKRGSEVSVCSIPCRSEAWHLRSVDKNDWAERVARCSIRVPPKHDCVMYDKEEKCCTGLYALWCTIGKCNFYKPNGEEK